jgi:peroxiredoxin
LLAAAASVALCKAPEKKAALPVIAKAADFTLKDADNREHKLSGYKGKVVLLNFFATWCPYCKEEVPELIKLNKSLKDKNFVLLSVNVQESAAKVKKFVESKGINYTVLLDARGKTAGLYNVHGIPTNVLVDKRGNVRYNDNAMPDVSLIQSLLSEKPGK